MKNYFRVPLGSREDVEDFFTRLFIDDLLFHPEDDPSSIVAIESPLEGESEPHYYDVFNEEECIELRKRLDEVFEYHEDPCDFILKTFYEPDNY